jgi:aminoglycoside phosphotransferase family enzyme/predicted kinase
LTAEDEVTAWLAEQFGGPIETAISRVFLGPEVAYKLKRHVSLGYVDFSTADRRLWALDRELAFNSRTCDVYRRLRPITRAAGGGLEWEGAGEVIDHALEMRRFDGEAVLAARPEAVDGELADALGRTIARFHAESTPRPEGGWRSMAFTIGSNAELLTDLSDTLGSGDVERLLAATKAEFEQRLPLLRARTIGGFARRCHGDLHLGNILLEAGAPVLFDCIEFNDLLSDIDVQYDLAFLLMDLEFRGRRDAATRVLSAYLDEAARGFPYQIWAGLAALPLMLSVRAGVRAHVLAHSGDMDTARRYLAAGMAHLSPAPPRLLAAGGLSGSGKSAFARDVAPGLGASPGAVILRTDEIRKRLAGLRPGERGGPEIYGAEMSVRTYDAMFDAAKALLAAGQAVVLDATFLDPALRARAEQTAQAASVPFAGIWLEAPPELLALRVAGRTGDASDADAAVLGAQFSRDPGDVTWTRLDAAGPPGAAARDWIAAHG